MEWICQIIVHADFKIRLKSYDTLILLLPVLSLVTSWNVKQAIEEAHLYCKGNIVCRGNIVCCWIYCSIFIYKWYVAGSRICFCNYYARMSRKMKAIMCEVDKLQTIATILSRTVWLSSNLKQRPALHFRSEVHFEPYFGKTPDQSLLYAAYGYTRKTRPVRNDHLPHVFGIFPQHH